MLQAAYVLNRDAFSLIYGPAEQRDIASRVQLLEPPVTAGEFRNQIDRFGEVEVIFSGWGGPTFDSNLLQALPHLKAVFYGAGSIKGLVTDAFWERQIPITSSYAANAIPVAEFTLSQILFSLKSGWKCIMHSRENKALGRPGPVAGAYGSTVGLVSLGMIGRRVAQLLQPFDLNVIAFDPMTPSERAAELRLQLCSLSEVFSQSDVVSLHTPWLKETEGMIDGKLIGSMKPGATLINTSRGAIINEPEMIAVLKERPDLWAVLDVTRPEPPPAGSALWELPNVILTPHIAGSKDHECRRMGRVVVDELGRFLKGEPLRFSINRSQAATMA